MIPLLTSWTLRFIPRPLVAHVHFLLYLLYEEIAASPSGHYRPLSPDGPEPPDHHRFLPAILLIPLVTLYGYFGLSYGKQPLPTHEWRHLLSTADQSYPGFIRQMFPPVLWPVTDGSLLAVVVTTWAVFVGYWWKPLPVRRYKLVQPPGKPYLRIHRRRLRPDVSAEIIAFRARNWWKLFTAIPLFYLTVLGNSYSAMLLNDHFRGRWQEWLFWCLFFPGLFVYVIYAWCYGMAEIALTAHCIQLQQRKLWQRLRRLTDDGHREWNFTTRWQHFFHINHDLIRVCADVRVYSDFWNTHLTIVMLGYVVVPTQLTYALVFNSIVLAEKLHILYACVFLNLSLFMVIDQCARVVRWNGRMARQNRNFLVRFGRCANYGGGNSTWHYHHQNRLFIMYQLKAETMSLVGQFRPYAFCMFANTRITSKTFHLLLTHISVFFMLVFRNQQRDKAEAMVVIES